jgi:PAS domain S-box-containing protein
LVEEKRTILLVEDEELLALTETRWLSRAGYNCIHVFSGEKAIELVNESNSNVDLILMDIDLGKGIDGTKAAEEILRDHDLPILFLSLHTEKEVVEKTERITSYGYVVKDTSNTVLLASIKMAFKLHKANKELQAQKKALRLSEEKFSKAFYTSPDAISISRLEDGVYLEINEGFTKITGFTANEILGRSTRVDDLNLWINKDEYKRFIKLLKENGEVSGIESEFLTKEGLIQSGLVSANIIELDGEKCVLVISRNITERKRIEEVLHISEERYKSIANNLPGVVFQIFARKNGEVGLYYLSERSVELLDIDNNLTEGPLQHFIENLVPEDRKKFRESTQAAITSFSKWNFTGTYIKRNGEEICLSGLAQPRQLKDEMIFDGVLLDITEQKRAVESLQKVNKLQSLILDNSTIGIAFVRNRVQEWVNSRMMEIFDLPIHQLQGVPTRTLYPSIDAYEKLGAQVYPLLAEGKKAQLEVEMKKGDGALFWCRLEGKALDPSKPNDGSIWIFEDISERKRIEETIRINEERFRQISESAREWIWEVNREGIYTYSNSVVEEALGYKPEELINKKHFYDLWSGETKDSLWEYLKNVFDKKENIFRLEHPVQHKNGSEVVFETSGLPIVNGQGELIGYRGTDTNITERILSEQRLKSAEVRYRTLFEQSPDGIVIVDPETARIVEFNETAHLQLGYTRQEFSNLSISDIDADENEEKIKFRIDEILKTKQGDFETRHRTRFGEIRNIHVKAHIIEVLNKQLYHCIWRDNTEQKQIENELRNSEKKIRSLFFVSPAGIGIAIDRNFTECNDRFCEMLGYNREELLGKRTRMIYRSDEEYRRIGTEVYATMIGNGYAETETQWIRKDGSIIEGLEYLALVDSNDLSMGVVFIALDITERKKIENNLRVSEEKIRGLFTSAPAGIGVVIDRKFAECNDRFCKMLGYSKEELLNHSTRMIYNSDSEYETYGSQMYREIAKVGYTEIEIRFRRKDGSVIEVLHYLAPLDPNDESKGVIFTSLDITERKRVEEQLQIKDFALRSSINAIGLADMNGNIIFVNDSYIKLWGYKNEQEVIGTNISNFFSTDQSAVELHHKIMSSLHSGVGYFGEGKAVKRDGTPFHVQISVNLVFSPEGKPISTLSSFMDITERIKSEELLVLLSHSIKSVSQGVSITDHNNNLLFVNQAFLNIYGYQEEEVIGRNIRIVKADEDIDYKGIIEKTLIGGFNGELLNRKKDGTVFSIHLSTSVIYNEKWEEIGLVGVMSDITEQKKIGREIQKSYAILEATLESTGDGILVVDSNGLVIRINKRFIELWSIPDELQSCKDDEKLLAFVTDQVLEPGKFLSKVRNLYNQQDVVSHDIIELKNGGVFERYSQPELVDGKAIGRVWSFHDITEQKKAELLVKESEASMKALIENVNTSIWSIDKTYALVDFNSIFAEFMQDAYNVKLTKGMTQQCFPKDIIDYWKSLYDIALAGQQISSEFSVLLKNELRYYETRLNPIIRDNEVTGVSVVNIDITERKKTETELETYHLVLEELIKERTQELENVNLLLKEEVIKVKEAQEKVKLALAKEIELNELKSRFVSTASHEFRTPLTAILATADLLEMYGRSWSETKYFEYLHVIQHTVEYMTELINDVLTYSKTETGKIEFTPMSVDLHKLVSGLLDRSMLTAPENIRFNFDFNTDQKTFYLDQRLITQVLTNLLSNAIKYSPDGGLVTVTANLDDDNLVISVSDEGIGISIEDQGKLFEPFSRAQNIGKIEGTGLGLSIVKKCIEIHNGKVILQSNLNKGTCVTVVIKVHQENTV